MKMMKRNVMLQALLAAGLVWGYSADAWATLVYTNQSANNVSAYDSEIKADDLINAGQSSLSSSTYGTWSSGTGPNLNDGSAVFDFSGPGGGTSYGQFATSPTAEFTFDQNYDLTKINSFYATNSAYDNRYANQYYKIEYKTGDGLGSWITLVDPVSYQPFSTGNDNAASFVSITDDGGVVASDVKIIKFSILNTGIGFDGALIKEFDVFGEAATEPVPEPSSLALLLFGMAGIWRMRKKIAS